MPHPGKVLPPPGKVLPDPGIVLPDPGKVLPHPGIVLPDPDESVSLLGKNKIPIVSVQAKYNFIGNI